MSVIRSLLLLLLLLLCLFPSDMLPPLAGNLLYLLMLSADERLIYSDKSIDTRRLNFRRKRLV